LTLSIVNVQFLKAAIRLKE